jgi:hypothetical protein
VRRNRVKQTNPLKERLVQEAQRLRDEAKGMPPGVEREALIRKARHAEAAAKMDEWLTSPGLQSPK